MTGFRAMRRRVCVSCQNQFVPKRLDAVTCSSRCRMAESRKREARAKAEALFKTRQQIAQNATDQAWTLYINQVGAEGANDRASQLGVGHIRFAGTQSGVLAVQAVREIDLPWPVPWWPTKIFAGRWEEKKHDLGNPETSDPAVIGAVVEVLKCDPVGWSFRRQEHLRECQTLLRGAVRKISLFTADLNWVPPGGWTKVPVWSGPDEMEELDHDAGPRLSYGDGGVGELIAGGGFQVFDKSKGHP